MNWQGLYTLFAKEVWRFLKVTMQTVLTPVVTNLLYLLVFSSVLEAHVKVHGLNYTAFLVPGLMMMSLIQNAFSNSSSSLFQSKMNGNIVFMLLAPLSDWEVYLAFIGAAIVRGILVGIGVWVAALWFVVLPIHNLFIILSFAILGSGVLGALGLIAALWAEKWDHVSAFQNFVILPLSFLSGVFYSINDLPPLWQTVSHYNPFFYMIDGFRYGFVGTADASVELSLLIVTFFFMVISGFCIWLLRIGYKLRY
ncbi:ABC-type polysaccharide/polyol phosphate export system, permease component [Beggiatoa alba B18LD]|uniref:Transport permease protein n=1 Tax=Beggiatoa alba B18LD TaxID=395493 RepID=I3CG85_9GAMM|nr:ABC transporter permease [Beggiatoa alba]EIJ42628.1 ABC-type polysaccharide/polyol phosphate export system, permease component [Beggiatoa alba B18LD]